MLSNDRRTIEKFLGRTCSEPVTKARGTCTAVIRNLNGNYRLALQEPIVDGKVPDTVWVDAHYVVVECDVPAIACIDFVPGDDYVLGSRARDVVSGSRGVLTDKMYYLNGCVKYALEGRRGWFGRPAVDTWFDALRIELIGTSLLAIAETNTGGPITTTSPRGARG